MRPQKVLHSEIIIRLTKVFRTKGYEGASLNDLAEATGLKKASLYHRFPKGKQEMALAVLTNSIIWTEESLFQALSDENNTPSIRLKNGIAQIRSIYDSGKEVCIFRALSMKTGLELFEKQVNKGMNRWIEAFIEIGLAFDLSSSDSKKFAIETLIEIQGSLIVTKGLGDLSIFEKTLQKIENRYLSK